MRQRVAAATAAIVLTGLTACTGGSPAAGSPPVLAPGSPGESASAASQDQLDAAAAGLEHNKADVTYVLMMIEHHHQALVMTDMVADRVHSGDLAKIADRIAAAQEPEIEAMEAWMEQNVYGPAEDNPDAQGFCAHGPDGGHGGHASGPPQDSGKGSEGSGCPVNLDHADMPGMADQQQLDELRAADGPEFDRRFVELMTAHHEGAITMAEEASSEGKHPEVLRMAGDVIAEQTADINRMDEITGG